jgi:beta-glucosidase
MKRRLRRARCAVLLAACLVPLFAQQGSRGQTPQPPYMNPQLPVERRVDDLISRMTLEEKVSQMMNHAGSVERLGVPEYEWWNEGLHGVARAGVATVFPQAIGLAATWDTKLMHEVADVISTEARAKHNEFVRRGERGEFTISVGGKQPGFKGSADSQTTGVASGRFVVKGKVIELPDR